MTFRLTSTSTIEQSNIFKLLETIKKMDPELFMFELSCLENGVSPMIGVKVNRELGNIAQGSGHGKLTLYVQDNLVTQLKGEESLNINLPIVIPENTYINEVLVQVEDQPVPEHDHS